MATPRQIEVLQSIHWRTRAHGCPPTYREIADGLGKTAATIHEQTGKLIEAGLLQKSPEGRARSLELTAAGEATVERHARSRQLAEDGNDPPGLTSTVLDASDFETYHELVICAIGLARAVQVCLQCGFTELIMRNRQGKEVALKPDDGVLRRLVKRGGEKRDRGRRGGRVHSTRNAIRDCGSDDLLHADPDSRQQ